MKNGRKYSFWFHYNKPTSRAKRQVVMTVHFRGKCILVRHINCHVGTETRERKSQPYCVMAGKCFNVHVDGDTATIL